MPVATTVDAVETQRPQFAAIVKHMVLSVLTANVIPSVLFYVVLRVENVWTALIAALVWCYGAAAWRVTTKRQTSMLLVITLVGLTVKTVLAFASGSTFLYFLQPAVNDGVIALLFIVSLRTARPVVSRLAADFYPMDDDVASRPRIQRLFWRLTLLWAVIGVAKCIGTVWLLESLSTTQFVAIKEIFILAVIVAGAAVTLGAAARVARHEGLLAA